MTKIISQFMWAFQHTFRRSVQSDVQRVLSQIGLQVDDKAKVLLVGLATRGDARHEKCIEPEDDLLIVEDLRLVRDRTEELVGADPESRLIYDDPRHHEQRRRALFIRCRAKAIAEAIQESGKYEGLSFFVSGSAPIEGYEVHTCIGIPIESLESVPRFTNPIKDDHFGPHIEDSFVHAIVHTCLGRATRALYLPYPGESLTELGDRTDIVRSSADRFVSGITYALTQQPSDLFRFANEISSLTYERSGAKGQLVVTGLDNLANKLKVTIENPVRLGETRIVRKMLELSDDTRALLTDGQVVYGLGECSSAPDVARISIEGHAKWSLSVDDRTLIRATYEHAMLPRQILDKDIFRDVAQRTVAGVEVERIWDIFQCALDNGHGTTIVVSENPVSEVDRLGQEALSIKPEFLDHKDVARLGLIDGAIVLGPEGRCYAFGVILDGLATSSGDRARGARFNSSIRYQRTLQIGTMVIVISDDGTVDLIPNLKPRVSRSDVEDAVQAFCDFSGVEGSDGEEWARRNGRVKELSFYLNREQCDRVNEAYEKEMDSRLASGGIKWSREPLQPDPDMNESFFLEIQCKSHTP